MDRHNTTRLQLGRVVATPGALAHLNQEDVLECLRRHASGDWGEVCEDDRKENELSVREGFRVISVYFDRRGEKFWIITEADRSVTTVLLPTEY